MYGQPNCFSVTSAIIKHSVTSAIIKQTETAGRLIGISTGKDIYVSSHGLTENRLTTAVVLKLNNYCN
jgi:hypothetical protein